MKLKCAEKDLNERDYPVMLFQTRVTVGAVHSGSPGEQIELRQESSRSTCQDERS